MRLLFSCLLMVSVCLPVLAEDAAKKPASAEAAKAGEVTLAEIDAKGIAELKKNGTKNLRLINVFATWCPPCKAEFPDLLQIHRDYSPKGLEMILLSVDDADTKDKVLTFLKDRKATTKNYLINESDGEKLVAAIDKDWQGEIPLTLIVSPEGKVVFKTIGSIDPAEVKKVIDEQLAKK